MGFLDRSLTLIYLQLSFPDKPTPACTLSLSPRITGFESRPNALCHHFRLADISSVIFTKPECVQITTDSQTCEQVYSYTSHMSVHPYILVRDLNPQPSESDISSGKQVFHHLHFWGTMTADFKRVMMLTALFLGTYLLKM